MTRARIARQGGFTLIELMVAGTLTLLLTVAIFATLNQTSGMAESMVDRVRYNQQAREAFNLLGDGAVIGDTDDSGTLDIGEWNSGHRGHDGTAATPVSLDIDRGRIHLNGAGVDRYTDTTRERVTCTGVDEPVAGCQVVGEVLAIGYFYDNRDLDLDGTEGEFPSTLRYSGRRINVGVVNRSQEIELQLVSPDYMTDNDQYEDDTRATPSNSPFTGIPRRYRERYRTIFLDNVDG